MDGLEAIGVIVGMAAFFGGVIGAYLKTKASNTATKEDIAEITRLQHEVIEDLRARTESRFIVPAERYRAHQEAHTRWIKVHQTIYSDEGPSKAIQEGYNWFFENSLYLDAKPRRAFIRALNCAARHNFLLKGPRDEVGTRQIKKNWDLIMAGDEELAKAVDLPPLAEDLEKKIGAKGPVGEESSDA